MEIPSTDYLKRNLMMNEQAYLDEEVDERADTTTQIESTLEADALDDERAQANREAEIIMANTFQEIRDEEKRESNTNSWFIQNISSKV